MGGHVRRGIGRLAVALTAVAVVTTAAGGTAHASSAARTTARAATGASAATGAGAATTASAATGTSPAAGAPAPSWPVDNLGQPVVRALSTYTALGGGGATSNGVKVPAPSASPAVTVPPAAAAAPAGSSAGSSAGSGTGSGSTSTEAVGQTANGDPAAYFLNMGNYSSQTAEFVAVDLKTEKTVLDTRLPSGFSDTGMAYSQADNAVFMGTGEGPDLYEYQVGGTAVTDLGPSIAGQTIWALAAGPDGTIWGGTYPGGDIFSYDPATKAFHDYGQAIPSETYITALLPTATGVYFGTQPDTDLGELDPGTGAITQIPLPAAYAGQAGKVSGLSMAGTRLFAGIDANVTAGLVWDTSSRSWVATISPFSSDTVSPPDPANPDYVYYRAAANIVQYNITTLTGTNLNWAPNAIPGAWAWVSLGRSNYPGQSLMFTYYTNDRIYGYNLATKATYYVEPTVQGSGDQLICLGEGPGGDVYAGAYLTPPGMGQWNPDTDAWSLLSGSGQVEGYGTYNGEMVWGRYPEGDLYYDDITKGWSPSSPVAIGDDQNRPVAFAEINDLEAVGSVPVSGRLGGDISMWDPATGALKVYSDPIPSQTPVSLVAYDGLLWGGTSIDGGYGITPTARSGELFAFDPTTGKVVFRLVPKRGAVNVSGLALDSAGDLWGLADSTLFEFNLKTRHIAGEEALSSQTDGSMYGIEHKVVFDHGRLFATTDGKLFHVDTVTWKPETLYDGPASNLTEDRYGQLYFVQEPSYVYRYDLPTTVYTPAVTAAVTRHHGRSLVTLTASEPGGVGVAEIDYRVGHGRWRVYPGGPVLVAGHQTVSYRAVDNAWSTSAIGHVVVGGHIG